MRARWHPCSSTRTSRPRRSRSCSGAREASTLGAAIDALATGPIDVRGLAGGERLLSLSVADAEHADARSVRDVLDVAAADFDHVVVDVGIAGGAIADELLEAADRIVVVGEGSPLGVARLCAIVDRLPRPTGGTAVVVNRVRGSAVGSRDAGRAIRRVVEAETGIDPTIVSEDGTRFDAAWLAGSVAGLAAVRPRLVFEPSPASVSLPA